MALIQCRAAATFGRCGLEAGQARLLSVACSRAVLRYRQSASNRCPASTGEVGCVLWIPMSQVVRHCRAPQKWRCLRGTNPRTFDTVGTFEGGTYESKSKRRTVSAKNASHMACCSV